MEQQDRSKAEWNSRAAEGFETRSVREEEIVATGQRNVNDLLGDIIDHLSASSRVLEIGCGVGRLLGPMAEQFGTVWGVDVSGVMVEKARQRLGHLANVTVLENNGGDLRDVPTAYFDLVYSYLALDCVPDPEVVRSYMREAHRVLKEGGMAKLQIGGVYAANPFRPYYQRTCDTWAGARFALSDAARLMEDAGFDLWEAYHAPGAARSDAAGRDECQHRIWVLGRKGRNMEPWEAICWASGKALERLVPQDAHVMLPEQKMAGHLSAATGGKIVFVPAYNPADGRSGVQMVEDLRATGAQFLVLSRYAYWWKESYPELFVHLARRYQPLEENPDFTIFDLRTTA